MQAAKGAADTAWNKTMVASCTCQALLHTALSSASSWEHLHMQEIWTAAGKMQTVLC